MSEFKPGEAIIATIRKRRYASGTVVSVNGDMIQVELQQPYKGADQQIHMSTWKQRMPACKLSRVS